MTELFNNASVKLSTANTTDIYQAPSSNAGDRAIILSCMVSNVDTTNNHEVTVVITDGSNAVLSTLAKSIVVPAKATLEVISNKVVLKQSQKIRATAVTGANTLEVTLSALELTV